MVPSLSLVYSFVALALMTAACSSRSTKVTYAPSDQFLQLKAETQLDGSWRADLQGLCAQPCDLALSAGDRVHFDFIRKKFYVELRAHKSRLKGTWRSKHNRIYTELRTAAVNDSTQSVGTLDDTQLLALRRYWSGEFSLRADGADHALLTRGDQKVLLARMN